MAVALVQADWDGGAVTSTTLVYASGLTLTGGNALVFVVRWDGAAITCTVADNLGNTYDSVEGPTTDTTGTFRMQTFRAKNITGGANYTPTATFSSTTTKRAIAFHELSGADTTEPVDVSSVNTQASPGTGTDAVTSTADTTTGAGRYIVGALAFSENPGTIVAGTGYTMRLPPDTAGHDPVIGTEDQIQVSAGSIAATFTLPANVNGSVAVMVALKPTGAGGTTRTPTVGVATLAPLAPIPRHGTLLTPVTP